MSKKLTLLFIMLIATSAVGEEAHKAWMKFLRGEWTYEIKELELKGKATWRLTAKGNGLVGHFVDSNGLIGHELAGWRSDEKKMFVNGYGSKGNYWVISDIKVTADGIKGTNRGILPDGRSYTGDFVGTKVNANQYEWSFSGKTGDGKDFKAAGKYTRTKGPAKKAKKAKKQ